jgi:hypothetical protein
MTTFDKREQGFEAKFAHDEEFRFKAKARATRLLGNWAATQLALGGDAAASYSTALVAATMEGHTADDILGKVSGDLAVKGISTDEVARKVIECLQLAVQQLESEA